MDILKIHSRKMNLTRGINLKKIAEQMSGSSGAEAKVSPTPTSFMCIWPSILFILHHCGREHETLFR